MGHRKTVSSIAAFLIAGLLPLCGCTTWSYRADLEPHHHHHRSPAPEKAVAGEPMAESGDSGELPTPGEKTLVPHPEGDVSVPPCIHCGLRCRGACIPRPWQHVWHRYGPYLMPPPESEELVMPQRRFHPVPTSPAFRPY